MAYVKALAHRLGQEPWGQAVARLTFFWPDRRRRDIRNAEHAMKAAYDGLIDAGVIQDDNADVLTHELTEFEVDRDNPRVEITVTRVEH